MSDRDLEEIKRRRLRELQRKAAAEKSSKKPDDWRETLNKVFRGRAWEVFETATAQFPSEMPKVRDLLVKLVLEGKIVELKGEQLFALLREIGLPVSLNTTITFSSHGKTKLLSDKFKENAK